MRTNPLLLSIVAALSACAEETFDAQGCISATAAQTSCPAAVDVRKKDVWLPGRCGDDLEVTAVKSGGTIESIVGQDVGPLLGPTLAPRSTLPLRHSRGWHCN